MPIPAVFLAGQRAHVDEQNAAALIGRLVFVAYRTVAQAIASGTVGDAANALSWDLVDLDILGGWSASNPTRFTPPIAGWYQMDGAGSFAATATASQIRGASWLINGSVVVGATNRSQVDNPIANQISSVDARQFAHEFNGTTDYVELAPFQNTGANLNTSTGSLSPSIVLTYGGPSV
jgi:hypothetical protein